MNSDEYFSRWIDIWNDTHHFADPEEAIRKALLKNPSNARLNELWVKMYSTVFYSPLGKAYLEKLKKTGILVSESLSKDIDIYSSQPYNKALYDSAKIIVDAEDSSIKGDLNSALEQLSKLKIPPFPANLSPEHKQNYNFSKENLKEKEIKIWSMIFGNAMKKNNTKIALKAADNLKRLGHIN